MAKKIKVALLFGGRSAEHEVSMRSARNIYDALDKSKYDISLIGITKTGGWFKLPSEQTLLQATVVPQKDEVLVTDEASLATGEKRQVMKIYPEGLDEVDVVFPILHGPYGEDGTVQGMLKLLGLPFVGSGVLGSAVGMDKDVMKRLLRDSGLPVAKFRVFAKHMLVKQTDESGTPIYYFNKDEEIFGFNDIKDILGLPFFVKPANLGSSVGVSKVKNREDFFQAVEKAFTYDTKILLEQAVDGREIECSVLGNDDPIASVAGEIITQGHDFYDYDAKYIDEDGAKLIIPADITEEELRKIQQYATKAFRVLCASGLARVDFFLQRNGEIYINEINTIPGFTSISMYPKLWEASGISYSELIEKLLDLAIERHEKEQTVKTSY